MKVQISLEIIVSLTVSSIVFSLLFGYAYNFYFKYQNPNLESKICAAQNIIQLGLNTGYVGGVERC
ncbi:MAG: hypothetical protein ACP5P2_02305 [Candidatus Micrarchaeia archaeon]|jgi:hypothetical protein